MIRQTIFVGAVILWGAASLADEAGDQSKPVSFAVARVNFEQNATDEDAEVVIEAKGGAEGLAKLTIVSPDGRTLIDFSGSDASTMGIRSFLFESPEPSDRKDIEGLKKAYPEGVYTFRGATSGGTKYDGISRLSHKLPEAATIIRPGDEAEGINISNLVIEWKPIENLTFVIVNVEQEEIDAKISAKLPGSTTSFTVPDGFLLPGYEYKIEIGTVTEDGNTTNVETTFTTADAE